MLKKCEEILREEEQKSKEFKRKNENIIREETEKYDINQKHEKKKQKDMQKTGWNIR